MSQVQLKQQLKDWGKELRELKQSRKQTGYINGKPYIRTEPLWKIQYQINDKKRNYRHYHIAYSLSRGTPYSKIESPGEFNQPDFKLIEKIKMEILSDGSNVLSL